MESGEKIPQPHKVGKLVGEKILKPSLDHFRKKAEEFATDIQGQEVLSGLVGKPFLIVSNHIRPTSKLAHQSELSPDAFIIEYEVARILGYPPRIIAKSDDGWWAKNSAYRKFQEKTGNFRRASMRGAGFIPVMKNPGLVNKELITDIEETISSGQPILIFPEGQWYDDFDPSHPLSDGAAHLALKYGLPIVPTYIRGSNEWTRGKRVELKFGDTIDPNGKQKKVITEEIRNRISDLQKSSKQTPTT